MLKQVIAQLKQNPGSMAPFVQGNAAFAGVNVKQQQAMLDIFKGQETAEDKVLNGKVYDYWKGEW